MVNYSAWGRTLEVEIRKSGVNVHLPASVHIRAKKSWGRRNELACMFDGGVNLEVLSESEQVEFLNQNQCMVLSISVSEVLYFAFRLSCQVYMGGRHRR